MNLFVLLFALCCVSAGQTIREFAHDSAYGTVAERQQGPFHLVPAAPTGLALPTFTRQVHTVPNGGISLNVVSVTPTSQGAGYSRAFDGKLFVFVPGSAGNVNLYGPVIAGYALAKGAIFVGVNPRTFGSSTQVADEANNVRDVDLASDVAAATNWAVGHFGRTLADVVLVGYSLGGFSAAKVAADLARAGTPPGLLFLVSSIDSVQRVVTRGSGLPRVIKNIYGALGRLGLGHNFDTRAQVTRYCGVANMRLVTIAGVKATAQQLQQNANSPDDHLALSETGLLTSAASCTVNSATAANAGHFNLNLMFSDANAQQEISTAVTALPNSPQVVFPTTTTTTAATTTTTTTTAPTTTTTTAAFQTAAPRGVRPGPRAPLGSRGRGPPLPPV